jgi:hypothetical protein
MDHFAGLDVSVKETTSEQTCRMVAFEPVAAIAAIRRTDVTEYFAGVARITRP